MSTSASPTPEPTSASGTSSSTPEGEPHIETAGAFDIRVFIGALIGLFGLIITLMGLFAFTPAQAERTGGLNADLWAGLAMIVVALLFVLWAKLDPIRMMVQENEPGAEEPLDISAVD